MGHDHHFLERLDRITCDEVDLALSLYRDHRLVAHILRVANLPADADRIAISLDDKDLGPFLIVQRDGHFVTCLGRGMKHDRPVLPRDRLDALVLQHREYRSRAEHARAATGRAGAQALFDAMGLKEDFLTREDVHALLAMTPLWARTIFGVYRSYVETVEVALPTVIGMRRLRTTNERGLAKAHWGMLWGAANMLVLLGSAPRAFLDEVGADLAEQEVTPTVVLASQGVFAITARCVWFASRAGRSLIANYKRAMDREGDEACLLDAACGLAAMGLRHGKLSHEALKAVRPSPEAIAAGDLRALRRQTFLELLDASERAPGREATQLEEGARLVVEMVRAFPEGSPFRAITRVEDVPVDLARTAMLRSMDDTIEPDGAGSRLLMESVPLIASSSAADFFFPEAFARAMGSLYSPERMLRFGEQHRAARSAAKPPPVSATRLQARNERCACESGRKFKKCCGA